MLHKWLGFEPRPLFLLESSHHLPLASDICAERLQSQKGVGLWNIPVNLDTRGEVMLIFLQTSIDRFQKEKTIDISPATCFWYMQRGSCLLISIDSSKKWPCWKSAFLCRISCFILYLSPIWIHSLHSFSHLHSHWSRKEPSQVPQIAFELLYQDAKMMVHLFWIFVFVYLIYLYYYIIYILIFCISSS